MDGMGIIYLLYAVLRASYMMHVPTDIDYSTSAR